MTSDTPSCTSVNEKNTVGIMNFDELSLYLTLSINSLFGPFRISYSRQPNVVASNELQMS